MKNTEELKLGTTETPIIVFCSDPPHVDPDNGFIRETGQNIVGEVYNFTLDSIQTTLKVNSHQRKNQKG